MKKYFPFNKYLFKPRTTDESQIVNSRYMNHLLEDIESKKEEMYYILKEMSDPISIDDISYEWNAEATEATITVTASGGLTPLQYRINLGTWQLSNEFTVTEEDTYNIDVKDEVGNVESGGVEVTIIPSPEDLTFQTTQRDGLTLQDSDSNAHAEILTPCHFRPEGNLAVLRGDKSRMDERVFDGNNYTLFFQATQMQSYNDSSGRFLFTFGGGAAKSRGFDIRVTNGGIRVYYGDGIVNQSNAYIIPINECDNITLPLPSFYVYCTVNFAEKILHVGCYDLDGEALGTPLNADISSFTFNSDENSDVFMPHAQIFAISNFKKYNTLRSLTECIETASSGDMQIHLPEIVSGTDVSGNNNHFSSTTIEDEDNKVYLPHDHVWGLDYGYSMIKSYHDPDHIIFYIPNLIDGTEIDRTDHNPTYYHLPGSDGSTNYHNLYDSVVKFTNNFFDRSNTTIWNDNARGADYDASNPKCFHISKLDQRNLFEWLHDDYKGRLFVKAISENYQGEYNSSITERLVTDLNGRRRQLREILLYATDKIGINHKNVLTYTGDVHAAVKNENDDIIYDDSDHISLGYFKASKPLLSIRFDDGLETQKTQFKPLLDSLGVPAFITLLTGREDGGNYLKVEAGNDPPGLTWDDVVSLHNSGWEIISHGVDDDDLSESSNEDVEEVISFAKNRIESFGITPHHFTPHKYGQRSPFVIRTALKHHMSCHAGYVINYFSDPEGVNPEILSLDSLASCRGDFGGDFMLDDPAGVANFKAQIDIAAANDRLLMVFLHGATAEKLQGLEEVVTYALSQGMEVDTLSGVLSKCKYLPKE